MKNVLLLSIFFILIVAQSQAQRVLSLEEAIATALHNNYDIQLAKNDSMVAAIDYSYRQAIFLPSVNATASTTKNNNRQKQILADDSERSGKVKNQNIQGGMGLNWVLFDGFKMFATRDKAAALLQAGIYAAKEQIVNTIAIVINTYYNIARQQQMIKATDMQIKLNEERAKLAQYRLDIGTGAKPDVLQSKVDLNSQRALRMQQLNHMQQLKQELVQVMNSNIQPQEFEVPDTIPVNYDMSIGNLQDGIDFSNPSLLLAKSRIDIAAYSLKESLASRWPTISFNSAYNFMRNKNEIAISPFSTKLNQSAGVSYGLGMQVPIFNQFRLRRQIQQDRLSLNMSKLNYDNRRSVILLNLMNTFRNYDQQKQQLKLEEENILLAQENVNILYQSYQLGHATLMQLREAQLSLAQANDRLIAARYQIKLAETELMRLRGDIVK